MPESELAMGLTEVTAGGSESLTSFLKKGPEHVLCVHPTIKDPYK